MAEHIDFIERSAAERIATATRYVERLIRNNKSGRGNWYGNDIDRWLRLTGDLDAGGVTTGILLEWDETDDGDYDDDTQEPDAFTIIDPTAQHWGVEGEIVRCRAIGTDNGDVFEIIQPGKEWHRGTITAEVCRDFAVDVTIWIHGVQRTVVAWNVFSPEGDCLTPSGSAGMRVGITYNVFHMSEYDDADWEFGANASGRDYSPNASAYIVTDPRWELTEAECG